MEEKDKLFKQLVDDYSSFLKEAKSRGRTMRLVDADKIMHAVRNTITEQSNSIDWLNLINQQPTAYDVDKVVERLENEKSRFTELCLSVNDIEKRKEYIAKEQAIALAIEIVKTGGIDSR